MPKLKFNYVTPIETRIVGNEIDPQITINVSTRQVAGRYFNRTHRLDTGEERTEYERPIPFSISLSIEQMNAMLQPVLAAATVQDVLRPAVPDLTEDVPPPVVTNVVVTILTPNGVNVVPGGTLDLDYTIAGVSTSAEVTWLVREGDLGTIDENGVYTAPAEPGIYRVVCKSVEDPNAVATVDITVV